MLTQTSASHNQVEPDLAMVASQHFIPEDDTFPIQQSLESWQAAKEKAAEVLQSEAAE